MCARYATGSPSRACAGACRLGGGRVLICVGIAFLAVYRGTGRKLRQQIDHELAGDASAFAHSLGSRAPLRTQAAEARRATFAPAVQRELDLALRARPRRGDRAPTSPSSLKLRPPDEGETVAEQEQRTASPCAC